MCGDSLLDLFVALSSASHHFVTSSSLNGLADFIYISDLYGCCPKRLCNVFTRACSSGLSGCSWDTLMLIVRSTSVGRRLYDSVRRENYFRETEKGGFRMTRSISRREFGHISFPCWHLSCNLRPEWKRQAFELTSKFFTCTCADIVCVWWVAIGE